MTAVEWLEKEFLNYNLDLGKSGFRMKLKQALEKEEVQIMNAYIAGDINGVESMIDDGFVWLGPEEYFNNLKEKEEL